MAKSAEHRILFEGPDGREDRVWGPEMTRALIDIIDNQKPAITGQLANTFRKPLELAQYISDIAEKYLEVVQDLPSDRVNEMARDHVLNKVRRIPLVDDYKLRSLLIYGWKAVDYSKLPKGTVSDEAMKVWREERRQREEAIREQKSRNSKKSRAEAAEQKKLHVTRGNQISRAPEYTFKALQNYAFTAAPGDGPPVQDIRNTAKKLREEIERAVRGRLLEAGRQADEVVDNLMRPGTAQWQEICDVLIDNASTNDDMGYCSLETMQFSSPLHLAVFARAVIGAAVTKWALLPSPVPVQEEQEPQNDFRNARLNALLELNRQAHALGGAIQNNVSLRRALKQCVYPQIPEKAASMAKDVDHMLRPFMMPQTRDPKRKRVPVASHKVNVRATGQAKQVQAPGWAMSWQDKLQKIFASALTFRLTLEEEEGVYTFGLPRAGETVSSGKQDDQSGSGLTVFIATFPEITAQFPDGPGGELLPSTIISEADFQVFVAQDRLDEMDVDRDSSAVSVKEDED